MVLLIYGDPIQGSFEAVQASLDKAKSTGLPVAVCYLGGAEVQVEEVNKFQEYGVPVFDEPGKAIVALGYLNQRRMNLSRIRPWEDENPESVAERHYMVKRRLR